MMEKSFFDNLKLQFVSLSIPHGPCDMVPRMPERIKNPYPVIYCDQMN